MKDYEAIEHTADIKIRVYGTTLAALFKHAVQGMFQSIKPKVDGCLYKDDRLVCPQLPQKRTLSVESPDINSLLVDFLSDALYLSDVNDEAYLDVHFKELTENSLDAELRGVKVTGFDVVEIKAVTYHDLNVEKKDGMWQTDIVFDI